uniref:Uncharacterized protein n=1 Tax=Ditylenchus dipsaci TaxID=166011 RepID=A0A915EML3_9BILA
MDLQPATDGHSTNSITCPKIAMLFLISWTGIEKSLNSQVHQMRQGRIRSRCGNRIYAGAKNAAMSKVSKQ